MRMTDRASAAAARGAGTAADPRALRLCTSEVLVATEGSKRCTKAGRARNPAPDNALRKRRRAGAG